MAIDLPPAIPPKLTNAEQIAVYASSSQAYAGKVDGYELRVTGDHYLSDAELARIFEAAETPSQAILLINSAAHRKGNLLVVLQYAPVNNVVHVHALQGKVAGVEGASEITPYFDGLVGDFDLKRSEFDRARVMANVRSGRTGVDYDVSYRQVENDPGNITLVFEGAPKEDHDSTDLILQLGNQGSRFVGRYFADAGVTHNFDNGTRLGLGYETAITEWGESREGDDYEQFQLKLDHPFSSGLYGIDASYLEYTQEIRLSDTSDPAAGNPLLGLLCGLDPNNAACVGVVTEQLLNLDAEVSRVGVSGEHVLSSDHNRRFSLYERLEYVDSQIEEASTGEAFQDENYTTLEVGAKYHRASQVGKKTLKWNVAASVKGGVTGDDGTLGTYDQFVAEFDANKTDPDAKAPTVTPSARTAEFVTFKPRVAAELALDDNDSLNFQFAAQIADEQLPQQQQWVLGGISQISAYLPGVLVGDTGYYSKGSYDHRWEWEGVTLSFSLFAEYGTAQFENASGVEGDTRSIADAGIGLTATFGKTLEVRAVAAESIDEENFDDRFLERTEADFFVTAKLVF